MLVKLAVSPPRVGVGTELQHQLPADVRGSPVAAIPVQDLNQGARKLPVRESIPWSDLVDVLMAEVVVSARDLQQVVAQTRKVDVDGGQVDLGQALPEVEQFSVKAVELPDLIGPQVIEHQ